MQQGVALDTSKLPRLPAMKVLVALPQTTIILSAETVPTATKAALDLLEANGWQRYESPGAQAGGPIHQMKKGQQALTVFVQAAPAHNNATSISYTEMPLSRDLPFPVRSSGIRFAPDSLHLDATVPMPHTAVLASYRAELVALGWVLHSASDGSAAMKIPTGDGMHHAFFTHPAQGALHVTAKGLGQDASSLTVRAVPLSVLPGAPTARVPAVPAPQPPPQTEDHARLNRQFDALTQDVMRQALQPSPAAPGSGIDAALAAARAAGVRVDIAGRTQPTAKADAEPALERDQAGGLPVPKGATSKSHETTNWRIEVTATLKASPDSVLAFYGRELAALGWREAAPVKSEGNRVSASYASAEGPAFLTIERKGRETTVTLLLRKEAEARKAGVMPKTGHARILFGNTMDAEATVFVGGKTLKVGSGVGAKKPDGPSLEVLPGVHRITFRSPNQPEVVETVTVRADDVWGVLLGPGGALPLPMY